MGAFKLERGHGLEEREKGAMGGISDIQGNSGYWILGINSHPAEKFVGAKTATITIPYYW